MPNYYEKKKKNYSHVVKYYGNPRMEHAFFGFDCKIATGVFTRPNARALMFM